MDEILLTGSMDLPELDACVFRLGFMIRVLSSGIQASAASAGTAPAHVIEEAPGMPLLSEHEMAHKNPSGMTARAEFSVKSDSGSAHLRVCVECLPYLGRTVVIAAVRSDLSNVPGPADGPEKAVAALTRLHALVRDHAERVRSDAHAGLHPGVRIGSSDAHNILLCRMVGDMAILNAPENLFRRPELRCGIRSGSAYGRARPVLRTDADPDREWRFLTAEAEDVLQRELRPIVALASHRDHASVVYEFGPTTYQVPTQPQPMDAAERQRWLGMHPPIASGGWNHAIDGDI